MAVLTEEYSDWCVAEVRMLDNEVILNRTCTLLKDGVKKSSCCDRAKVSSDALTAILAQILPQAIKDL